MVDFLSGQLLESSPSIRALGSLFKLTEVHLWETSKEEGCSSYNVVSTSSDFSALKMKEDVDLELTRQLNELGLPLSFQTSKKKMKNVAVRGKKKDARSRSNTNVKYEVRPFRVSKKYVLSLNAFCTNSSNPFCILEMLDEIESSFCDLAADINKLQCFSGEIENSATLTANVTCKDDEKCVYDVTPMLHNYLDGESLSTNVVFNGNMTSDVVPDVVVSGVSPERAITDAETLYGEKDLSKEQDNECLENSTLALHSDGRKELIDGIGYDQPRCAHMAKPSQSPEVLNFEENESWTCYGESGDWKAYWDSFYMRYYFYNTTTFESKWCPPPGLEHLASDPITIEMNELNPDTGEMNGGGDAYSNTLTTMSYEQATNPIRLADQLSCESMVGMENIVNDVSRFIEDSEIGYESTDACNTESGLFSTSGTDEKIDGSGVQLKRCDGIDDCCRKSYQTFVDKKDEKDPYEESWKNASSAGPYVNLNDNANVLIPYSEVSSLPIDVGSEDDKSSMHQESAASVIGSLDFQPEVSSMKQKKKARGTRTQRSLLGDHEGQKPKNLDEYSAEITKYWCQRYLLFSRFDKGIKMDQEGWYSVTPELIARHHASRCGSGVVLDLFTGVGGNAIQFARRCGHVIAIDIDPRKIEYAKINAAVYGVDDHIDFIVGDSFNLAAKLKANTVFLSPPWGGPDYAKFETYNIKTMLKPQDGYFLFNTVKALAERVIMFLPRNVDLNQLAEISLSATPPWSLEVEKNYLNGKLKAITAYFTDTTIGKTSS